MKKIFDFFDMLVALGFGSLITTVLSTAIYALDAPRLLIVLVLALITLAIAVLVSYKIGWHRAKTESLIALVPGVSQQDLGDAVEAVLFCFIAVVVIQIQV